MKKLLPFLLLLPVFTFAQKINNDELIHPHPVDERTAKLVLPRQYAGTQSNSVSTYLMNVIPTLRSEKSSLIQLSETESKTGFHFLFAQQYDKVTVYDAAIKVNVDKNGYVTSLFDNSYVLNSMPPSSFPSKEKAEIAIKRYLSVNKKYEWLKYEPVFFDDGEKMYAAARVEVLESPTSYFEVIFNNDGSELYKNDLAEYYCPPPVPVDSMVKGHVFLPDPLTSAGLTYGTPYEDSSDNDVAVLNAERVLVDFNAQYDPADSSFSLISPYVEILELSDPVTVPAKTDTPYFSYTRTQSEFEDVNVFYHLSTFHSHIVDLGFNLVNYAINVDPHAMEDDNSMFVSGSNPPSLLYGQGGVDDGEDADVILHEYGHAIMNSAAPFTNIGLQRKSLDEANGDYFASSYSRYLNSFKWENVFSWDGHNPFWPGRSSVSTKHYPEGISNNFYTMTDIWSGTMMQIWGDLGRDKTDELLLESAYNYSKNITMSHAAFLIMQADTVLNAGANGTVLLNRFVTRGLLDSTGSVVGIGHTTRTESSILVTNTTGFTKGTSPISITFNDNPANATIELYSSQGVLVTRDHVEHPKDYTFLAPRCSPGVYILNVFTPKESVKMKLIKL